MEKVNCGFCGALFSASEEKCPVCGFFQKYTKCETDVDLDSEFSFLDEKYAQRKKAIFDYDEENDDSEEEYEEEESTGDEEYVPNSAVIVILVIIIALLLLATGFVFFRYFIPNVMDTVETTIPTVESISVEDDEATNATIPCKMLAMTSQAPTLIRKGQPWLLHISVSPENTTDELIYISEDESVVTVSEDGKIIAVGEGSTVVKIICGEQMIKCPVVVDYSKAIDETTQDNLPTMGIEEPESSEEAAEEKKEEQTKETEDVLQEESVPSEIVLKIKESDISLSKVRGITYELTMDCDLTADQIEWITLDSNVLIVRDGVITVMGPGTTKVVAMYNGQRAECIVRCIF